MDLYFEFHVPNGLYTFSAYRSRSNKESFVDLPLTRQKFNHVHGNGGGNGGGGNNNNNGGANGGGGNNNNNGGANGGGGNNNNNGGANGGGGNNNNRGGGNRTVELQPHPVKEQLLEFSIVSTVLLLVEALVLGFQHYLLSLGITVLIPSLLVPHMGGGDV
ncbi:Xanthine/uracil/vitamin C permease protein [Raphanus sativus]|nr:Xanthine/uracil/vitamin C permease protein [Raphanus sativus]